MSVTLHTSLGDLKIEVFCERTPMTAYNFLALCACGYYDGCLFHRNIKEFMVQTGDPTGTGKGGQSIYGKYFDDEFAEFEHVRGTVSMANKGPDTNGSQFFICYNTLPYLNKKYTLFGKVIHGMDSLAKIEKAETDETNRPLEEIKINGITIHANPLAENDVA
eukprot:TRINITY_DN4143_c0_g1_i1.p1 TRINITY_DN4143_c0_g1~~TRINITY_DN4143_c0_g1_i1.p1  ORF type:complete len:190 (-),score=30.72 TRINITY_DN4143_c0_g1_i1:118-606(-)